MGDLPPPPKVSKDGKFYWDGERWIAMPAQPAFSAAPVTPAAVQIRGKPTVLTGALVAGLVIAGILLAIALQPGGRAPVAVVLASPSSSPSPLLRPSPLPSPSPSPPLVSAPPAAQTPTPAPVAVASTQPAAQSPTPGPTLRLTWSSDTDHGGQSPQYAAPANQTVIIHIRCPQDQQTIGFKLTLMTRLGAPPQTVYGNTCQPLQTQDMYFDATVRMTAAPQGPYYFQFSWSNTWFAWTISVYA